MSPFAEYENMEDCIAQNSDKDDPAGYCASVMRAIEGETKETDWFDVEAWYNDRIVETFISSPIKDSQGDLIRTETLAEILPWLTKYGYYEWQHSGFPIGQIIGWRIEEGKPKIRVGIHDSHHSKMKVHDKIWSVIKEYGLRGFSSIKGLPELTRRIRSGSTSYTEIESIGVYGVGWVGHNPANPGAQITYVNELAKERAETVDELVAEISRSVSKGEFGTVANVIAGLGEKDSRIARELAEIFVDRGMSWEESIAAARERGAKDPERISGWLFYRGREKDRELTDAEKEEEYRLAQERLEANSFVIEVPPTEAGRQALIKLMESTRKKTEAKERPLQERTMSEKDLKQEPEEEAPAEAPEEAPAEEEAPEVRDLAAEVDELKAQVIALAEAVAGLREGTEDALVDTGAQAEEIAAETEEIETVEVEASKILDEKVEAAVSKALSHPARAPRGVGEDVNDELGSGLSKSTIQKVGRGEIPLSEWRERVGIRRKPA